VQETVRSHTEVEAEGAHERLVADDDGDRGHHGEAQRPHRPQLELLPADAHHSRPPSEQTTEARNARKRSRLSDHPARNRAARSTCSEKGDRPTLISETASAAGGKEKRVARDLPLQALCRCTKRRRAARRRIWAWGARIWATARQWRGDLGVDRWQWRARPDGLANQGAGEEGDKEGVGCSLLLCSCLYGAGAGPVAVGEKVIQRWESIDSPSVFQVGPALCFPELEEDCVCIVDIGKFWWNATGNSAAARLLAVPPP
jgi:hypothetical protein